MESQAVLLYRLHCIHIARAAARVAVWQTQRAKESHGTCQLFLVVWAGGYQTWPHSTTAGTGNGYMVGYFLGKFPCRRACIVTVSKYGYQQNMQRSQICTALLPTTSPAPLPMPHAHLPSPLRPGPAHWPHLPLP